MTTLALALFSLSAHAAPAQFTQCRSEIVTEKFVSCPDGEGGTSEPCGSEKTKWGDLTAELQVDSKARTASATVIYVPVGGRAIRSATNCKLGEDQWMSCRTRYAVPTLGNLEVTFNINGIGPDVYFVDVFADATNVPVGGFQTEQDCKR